MKDQAVSSLQVPSANNGRVNRNKCGILYGLAVDDTLKDPIFPGFTFSLKNLCVRGVHTLSQQKSYLRK